MSQSLSYKPKANLDLLMSYSFTPYQSSDNAWILDQHERHYVQLVGFDDSFTHVVQSWLEQFQNLPTAPCNHGWIAWHREQRVGCILSRDDGPDGVRVHLFYVHPSQRSKGLGKLLLSTLIENAIQHHKTKTRVQTYNIHHEACQLYHRLGFSITEEMKTHDYGHALRVLCFEKDNLP
ncbi:MAG: N-acetyltransferase [Deltaproteobacteria bacterium]|nr:MAG: N-acetyltransferase [Deltaproteobacteria bacterium]